MKHRADDWRHDGVNGMGVTHCSLCPCDPELLKETEVQELNVRHPHCDTIWLDETEIFLLAITDGWEW